MSELVKALRDAYGETDTVYFHLRTIIKDAADTIDRLTAELEEYKSTELTANEYRESVGFVLRLNKAVKQATGKTALDWEELTAENARLTERLGMAVGDMKFVFEQKRAFADSEVLDGVDCICPLCACWLGDGAKSCDGDCNNAQWRGEESK